MYTIPSVTLSDRFIDAWQIAAQHICQMSKDSKIEWIRTGLDQPLIEHLSFVMGNQLFFVFVDSSDSLPLDEIQRDFFIKTCREARAHPCVMKMVPIGDSFTPTNPGWGFIDAITGFSIVPPELVNDECIEISDWELYCIGTIVIRRHLLEEGKNILLTRYNPHIDPSIWFEDKNGPSWVIVRSARYPERQANRPDNILELKDFYAADCYGGNFTSVTIAADNEVYDPCLSAGGLPIYRGSNYSWFNSGLEPI